MTRTRVCSDDNLKSPDAPSSFEGVKEEVLVMTFYVSMFYTTDSTLLTSQDTTAAMI